MKKIVHKLVFSKKDDLTFLILISFLPTFVLARLYVYLAMKYDLDFFVVIKGVHIHHLSYGIILLALAGYLALVFPSIRRKIALLYGVGLALAFDEFGMWLRLEDNYWLRQSYDAVIILFVLFFNIVYLKKFWRKVTSNLAKIFLVKKILIFVRNLRNN